MNLLWWPNWVMMMPTSLGCYCLYSCTYLMPSHFLWCYLPLLSLSGACPSFPNNLCIWDPHKNQGNKIILPARGTGSLQYATVSRENLGLWHPTKSCNTKKTFKSWDPDILGVSELLEVMLPLGSWNPGVTNLLRSCCVRLSGILKC